MLAREQAFARRLQQRLVTFSLISREELAYDAKPGSPENPREPRPEAGASLVSEKAVVVRYGPHIATDPTLLWSMSRGRSRGQSNDGPIGQGVEAADRPMMGQSRGGQALMRSRVFERFVPVRDRRFGSRSVRRRRCSWWARSRSGGIAGGGGRGGLAR